MTLVFDETDLGDDFGDGLGVDLGVDDLDLGDADNILFIHFPFSPTLFSTGITPDITSFTGDSSTSSSVSFEESPSRITSFDTSFSSLSSNLEKLSSL